MRSFGGAMATLSVATLAAGLLWPHLAATFLQVLLTALALGYLGARIYRARLPVRLSSDTYSPFEGVAPRPPAGSSPPAVRHMTTLLQAVTDPEAARTATIPKGARRILVSEASRRLAEHHGLSLGRPADGRRIRALVSGATWTLLPSEATGSGADPDTVPMRLLENVLDDVERL